METRPHYLSYLLRLWMTEERGRTLCRALLERSGTGERWGFPSLAALFAFLEARVREEEVVSLHLDEPEERSDLA